MTFVNIFWNLLLISQYPWGSTTRGAIAASQFPLKDIKTVVCGLKVENKSPMFNI